jgi:hypothetical protein
MRSRDLNHFPRGPGFLEGKREDEHEGLSALLTSLFLRVALFSSILHILILCRIFSKPKTSLLKYNLGNHFTGLSLILF